jgi:hypothetical protein
MVLVTHVVLPLLGFVLALYAGALVAWAIGLHRVPRSWLHG